MLTSGPNKFYKLRGGGGEPYGSVPYKFRPIDLDLDSRS